MAIPFVFPSDEDTEANYQRLDQLLSDLFDVLQQILVTQRRIRDSQAPSITPRIRNGQLMNNRRNGDSSNSASSSTVPPPEPSTMFTSPEARITADFARTMSLQPASSSTASALPSDHSDPLRFGAPMTHDRSPIRRRRRRRRTSESSCCEETKPDDVAEVTASPTTTAQDWTQVGVNLRKIADDFYASVGKEESSQGDDSKRPCGVEASPADASLLSMLVPPPFSGSIWTAVIFVVGWRLLARAR